MDFDLKKLKKRPAYPFETVAVAVAFSPRLEAVLSEAKRISDTLRAGLVLLHIGPKTDTKQERLDKMMDKLKIDPNHARVIWMDGNPVETILKLCKLNIVDLLIIGALEKENLLKFYLGSVARNISRKAKCSVLLLTDPNVDASKPKKIIVNGVDNPKTIHTINTALYLAKHYHIKEITVAKEVHIPALAMTMANDSTAPEARDRKKTFNEEEEEKLQHVLDKCNAGDITVNEKIITGKPGFAISKYARDKKADLLVINSPDTQLNVFDRIFTHDIEYILADLPCNVMIVHSRV
jgi:nucleotide-binding universal stress UspA family protein